MQAVASAAPEFAPWARLELEAHLPSGTYLEPVARGAWLLATSGGRGEPARALRETVFVRQVCPADVDLPVDEGADGAGWARRALPRALAALRGWPPAGPVQPQVQLLPGGPAWSVGGLLAGVRAALAAEGIAVSGRPADRVLSVVVGEGRAFVGLGGRDEQLSPWPGGAARLRRRPGQVARSARKLEEALLVFGISLVPGGTALDLGAAPGGWTRFLLDRGLSVVAVDPGRLDPRLQGAPGLTHLRASALRVPLPRGPFQFLAADLNWEPLRAAECALRFRRRLAPGAAGVFTIKFFGRDPLQVVAEVRRRLADGFRVRAVRHLSHDRAEATAHLEA